MPGPIPNESRRRTNAPTIPTTSLPLTGRPGPVPRLPKWIKLGPAGTAWWRWAWKTPQAAAWAPGHEVFVAHRASLEDDLAAIDTVQSPDALDLLDTEELQSFRCLIVRLASVVSGRLGLLKEMREIDRVLGFTPKGMADLRWAVVAAPEPAADAGRGEDEVAKRREDRKARIATG